MENLLKEINKKKVGPYKLTLFAHIKDTNTGAMGVFVENSNKLLHHTGHIHKKQADNLFHGMKQEAHIANFLKAAQREHTHPLFSVKY
jgi:hypothetical protein